MLMYSLPTIALAPTAARAAAMLTSVNCTLAVQEITQGESTYYCSTDVLQTSTRTLTLTPTQRTRDPSSNGDV